MAKWIKASGVVEEVKPANGKMFTLEELKKFVGGYIEVVLIKPNHLRDENGKLVDMLCNEDGKRLQLPVNIVATKLAGVEHRGDVIVGDALLISGHEWD